MKEGLINDFSNEKDHLKEEREEKEKKRLIKIFHRLGDDLDRPEIKSINKVLKNYMEIKGKKSKKIDKIRWIDKFLKKIIFHLFLSFLCILNLGGIFIILSIYQLYWLYFCSCFLYSMGLKDVIPNYNFYDFLFQKSLNYPIDFNLVCIMNFLGNIVYDSLGFSCTSFIFLILNAVVLVAIFSMDFINRDSEINHYSFFKILYLFLLFVVMFFSVGSSSILAQQRLIRCMEIYHKMIKREEKYRIKKEEKKKIEKEIDTYIEIGKNDKVNYNENEINSNNNNEEDYKSINSSETDADSNNTSNELKLLRLLKKQSLNRLKTMRRVKTQEEKEDLKQLIIEHKKVLTEEIFHNKLSSFTIISVTTFLGYSLKYYILNIKFLNMKLDYENTFNKTDFYNDTNYNNITINYELYKNDKKLFFYIIIIYSSLILFSIILNYCFSCVYEYNPDKNQKASNGLNICCIFKIFGFIIYSENNLTEESSSKKPHCCGKESCCCKSLLLGSQTIKNYCDKIICNACLCCCNINAKCPCCCEYKEEDYDKNHDFFIYIYREKTFCEWLNIYLTNDIQIEMIPYLIEYFMLQLITMPYEEKYKQIDINDKNNITFLINFLACFSIYLIVSYYFGSKIKKYNENNDSTPRKKICGEALNSNEILFGLHYIIVVNSFLAFLNSAKKIFITQEYNLITGKTFSLLIFDVVIMNRFCFFTLNYYILNASLAKRNKSELISLTILISIYISFFNALITLIKSIFKSMYALYIIQFSSSLLIILYIIKIMISFIFENCFKSEQDFCSKCENILPCEGGICFINLFCCNKLSCFYCKKCDENCSTINWNEICCECCSRD